MNSNAICTTIAKSKATWTGKSFDRFNHQQTWHGITHFVQVTPGGFAAVPHVPELKDLSVDISETQSALCAVTTQFAIMPNSGLHSILQRQAM